MKKTSIIVVLLFLEALLSTLPAQNTTSEQVKRMKELTSNDLDEYVLFLQTKDSNRNEATEHARLFTSHLEYNQPDTLISDIYQYIADYNANVTFKYRAAIYYQNKVTDILRQLNLPYQECMSQVLSAKYNNNIGKHHIALNQLMDGMRKAEKCKNMLALRECWLNLGTTYYYCGDSHKAIEYYKKISSSSSSTEEEIQRVIALNNLLPFTESAETQDSLINAAIAICDKHQQEDDKSDEFNSLRVLIYLNLSLAYIQREDLPQSKKMLDTAMNFTYNFRDTGFVHTNSGIYYMEKKDTALAIRHFNQAINYLSRGDFDSEVKYILYFIQNLYAKTGSIDKAYNALLQYNKLEQKLAKDEALKEIFKLQKQIDIVNLHKETADEKNKMRIISLLFIILLLLIILALFILYNRHRTELKKQKSDQEKIQQELKQKNDIINIKRLQQHQENNFIDTIVQQLQNITDKTASATIRADIMSLIRQMNNSKDKSDWAEAEKTLQEINSTFYENLVKEFPNLTPNERRLCSLIHMNMSTKEIANITHQSIGSINTARTRLRKKLNITGDDQSLTAFLDRFN